MTDIMTKGTLLRVCLAVFFTAGSLVFLAPIFTGILNIGNAAGMCVCAALTLLSVFWGRLMPLLERYRALRVALIAAAIAALLLMVLGAVISVKMVSAANRPPQGKTTVIVLGCKVKGETPSVMLNKRIMAACDYLKSDPEAVCIVSGGQGSDELISEAECMKRVLTENGIPENRIIMEDKSESTDENIRFSLEKIRENGLPENVTVVTSEFHQLRAKMLAEKYGLESSSISAKTVWYLLPTYWLREWFGVTYQFLLG